MSWGLSAAWLLIPTLTLSQLQQVTVLLMFAMISVLMGFLRLLGDRVALGTKASERYTAPAKSAGAQQ
eukprot:491029-Rhodomonas_salina.1